MFGGLLSLFAMDRGARRLAAVVCRAVAKEDSEAGRGRRDEFRS